MTMPWTRSWSLAAQIFMQYTHMQVYVGDKKNAYIFVLFFIPIGCMYIYLYLYICKMWQMGMHSLSVSLCVSHIQWFNCDMMWIIFSICAISNLLTIFVRLNTSTSTIAWWSIFSDDVHLAYIYMVCVCLCARFIFKFRQQFLLHPCFHTHINQYICHHLQPQLLLWIYSFLKFISI